MEVNELVKKLEEEFGVSAAAQMMAAGPVHSKECKPSVRLTVGIFPMVVCR